MRVPIILLAVVLPTFIAARRANRQTEQDAQAIAFTVTQKPKAPEDKTEEKSYEDITQQDNSEVMIKDKLVNLLMSSKHDITSRMKKINSIHEVYKSERMYKIGYLVSFVNKLYQRLSESYTNIETHKYTWNTLQILNAYEEVKYSNDYLREVLRVLNMVVSSNLKMLKSMDGTRLRKSVIKVKKSKFDVHPLPTHGTDKKMQDTGISWSYYDDTLMK